MPIALYQQKRHDGKSHATYAKHDATRTEGQVGVENVTRMVTSHTHNGHNLERKRAQTLPSAYICPIRIHESSILPLNMGKANHINAEEVDAPKLRAQRKDRLCTPIQQHLAALFLVALVFSLIILQVMPASTLGEALLQEVVLAIPTGALALAAGCGGCPSGSLGRTCGNATRSAAPSHTQTSTNASTSTSGDIDTRSSVRCARSSFESHPRIAAVVLLALAAGIIGGAYSLYVGTFEQSTAAWKGALVTTITPGATNQGITIAAAATLEVIALCLLTALFEESLFRGLGLRAFHQAFQKPDEPSNPNNPSKPSEPNKLDKLGEPSELSKLSEPNKPNKPSNPLAKATFAQALLFALMHLSIGQAFDASCALVWLNLLLKGAQAFLFALVMAELAVNTGSLRLPIALHAGFDILYLGPGLISGEALTGSYLSASAANALMLAASSAFLLAAALVLRYSKSDPKMTRKSVT